MANRDWYGVPLLEVGRQLVQERRFDAESIVECAGLSGHWREQRERVQRSGVCADRCRVDKVKNAAGELVCPHTFQPCNREEVLEVVNKWSLVNK